ncbi:YegP family protein [Arthrobacter celericrescens]|uniref:YegP family protein n=1 Tax=Arthrobacter celericrescens TaxID=2320851 RepID=UPI00196991E4|nr:DUF1508 domain-containing protein [Arthrobacter celericrescens]
MSGMFEVFIDEDESFKFRLKAPDGTVVAVSMSFPDKPAVVCGIRDVREYAGMGHITDLCPEVPVHGSSQDVLSVQRPPAAAPQPPAPSVPAPQLPMPQRPHGPLLQKERAVRPWHTGNTVECAGLVEA